MSVIAAVSLCDTDPKLSMQHVVMRGLRPIGITHSPLAPGPRRAQCRNLFALFLIWID